MNVGESGKSNVAAGGSLKIHYWFGEGDLVGVNDFRREVGAEFDSVEVVGRQGGLGGGLYTLFVEIASTLTLRHVVQLLLDGVAFDLIKLGTERLVLKPLLEAQAKLRARNTHYDAGEIAQLRIHFRDTVIVVDAASRVSQNVADSLKEVFRLISQNYDHLLLSSGERPTEVYVPVVEDIATDAVSRYRAVLEVDEHLRISSTVLFEYWGISYGSEIRRVFDVRRRLLIDEPFVFREAYWKVMGARWRRERESH
jgi:hypothetical protein